MNPRKVFLTSTLWIIFLFIGFRIFQLGSRIYSIILAQKVLKGSQNEETLRPIDKLLAFEQPVGYFLLVIWVISFLIWFYLSYKRAQENSKHNFSYKPIWALFALIIPIFNIFAPYKIMREIWWVENGDPSQEDTGRKLINSWWFLSIVLVAYSRYLNAQFEVVDGLKEFIHAEYLYIVLHAVGIHYFITLQKLLKKINCEQSRRDERFHQ